MGRDAIIAFLDHQFPDISNSSVASPSTKKGVANAVVALLLVVAAMILHEASMTAAGALYRALREGYTAVVTTMFATIMLATIWQFWYMS